MTDRSPAPEDTPPGTSPSAPSAPPAAGQPEAGARPAKAPRPPRPPRPEGERPARPEGERPQKRAAEPGCEPEPKGEAKPGTGPEAGPEAKPEGPLSRRDKLRDWIADMPERAAEILASGLELAMALRPFVPILMAALVFLGGVDLLLSGTSPTTIWRRAMLRDVLPLPFAEASHLSASLAGLALIVLARGLALRMAKARIAATLILLAGAVFALVRGLQWEAALGLTLMAALLTLARSAFYRRGDWRAFRPTTGWLVLIAITVAAATLVGVLGYRNHTYRTEEWWIFAWNGDAPRFLRASLALAVATLFLALDALINRPIPTRPRAVAVPPAVRRLIADSPESLRQVALLGDKRFLVSPNEDAFLMYGISGRSWIALGGPAGDPAAGDKLIWRFAELADRAGARPVFYNVPGARIEQLLDLGQAILKTGEHARVDLRAFSMEGPARKDLRYSLKRAGRDGLVFEVIPRAQVPAAMAELRAVSDVWLSARKGREKGFSLGAFEPAYMAEFDVAVMRREGAIVAFANLWQSGHREEVAIDLMRHLEGQSPVLMEAMMCETILWAKAQGFNWFSLGGAPLAGLPDHPLAPVWARIGTLIYRRGDEFYSFDGLRRFKQKFGPTWSAQYMTCPSGLSVARALIDVAMLISRPRRTASAEPATDLSAAERAEAGEPPAQIEDDLGREAPA